MNTRRALGFAAAIVLAMTGVAASASAESNAVSGVRFTIIGTNATNVSWVTPAPADRYAVFVNGSLALTTSSPEKRVEVTIGRLLGPADRIQVNAIGSDGVAGPRASGTYWTNDWVSFPASTVHFADGSNTLLAPAMTTLQGFLATVRLHGFTDVKATGHNAGPAGAAGAYALGKARAWSILNYLSSNAGTTSYWSSWGNGAPLVSNDSAAGRALNRRVELAIR